MSVTSGFFNSVNGDRKYTAEQFSYIFNSLINDGVFANVGDTFFVSSSTGSNITVGIGFAWFNSTWVRNDGLLTLTVDASEVVLHRYDAVVIEVDHSDSVRKGDIKIVKGTPASTPDKPDMAHTEHVDQYPLAYIYRAANSTTIGQDDITNAVGTSDCPYVTGILEVRNINNIVAQWQQEWATWKSLWTLWGSQWDEWYLEHTSEAESDMADILNEMKGEFETWFDGLQAILDGDVAANLASDILELQNRFRTLAKEYAVYEDIQDSSYSFIEDSNGNSIEGKTVLIAPVQVNVTQGSTEESTPSFAAYPKLQSISLPSSGWSSKSQTVTVDGVSSNELAQKITVAPASASRTNYVNAGVQCVSQGSNSLTFTAETTPSANLTVLVTIEEVVT